ncbi:MAG: RloB domain-containing protein [Chloroflexi bacterium]|nr:RloB domain-containing protein [Chloroflexota bacterium]
MPKNKPSGRQKGRERFRSNASFDRRPGHRPPRQCFLIVCEGAQTEPNYFESLCRELKLQPLVEVQVEGQGAAPISVVNRALIRREEREREAKAAQRKSQFGAPPFDEVWCVFDVEKPDKNPSFQQAVSKARSNKLELAISNPAFEYWYLLHFKETTQPFADATELIQALKDKNCLPNYEKNLNVCNILFPYTDTAIERADRLLAHHPDAGNDFPNPSTLIYRLVKKLKAMSHLQII